jgi:hypothetical protein
VDEALRHEPLDHIAHRGAVNPCAFDQARLTQAFLFIDFL